MSINTRLISFTDSSSIYRCLSARESFRIIDASPSTAEVLETKIENKGLRCRIYTAKRSAVLAAGLIPTGVTQITAFYSAIGIAAHNLMTYNPDYEIVKYVSDSRTLDVVYKK